MKAITLDVRLVSKFGITFLATRWWHRSLVDYIGAEVYVCLEPKINKTDTVMGECDLYVFDNDLRMICQATRLQDPRRVAADLDRYGEDTE
jgi:hypothetical protein